MFVILAAGLPLFLPNASADKVTRLESASPTDAPSSSSIVIPTSALPFGRLAAWPVAHPSAAMHHGRQGDVASVQRAAVDSSPSTRAVVAGSPRATRGAKEAITATITSG